MRHRIPIISLLAVSLALTTSCAQTPTQTVTQNAGVQVTSSGEIVIDPDQAVIQGRQTGTMTIQVKWPGASDRSVQAFPASTSQFRLKVSAEDLPQPLTATINRPTNATTATVQLTVPAGSKRTLLVEGLNASNQVVARAEKADLTIAPAEYVPVTMALETLVGGISGVVINQETGKPEPGVLVKVGEVTTISDAEGRYTLQDIAPGTYDISFSKGLFETFIQSMVIVKGAVNSYAQTPLVRKHWIGMISGTDANLRGVQAVSPTEAWAWGDSGTLIHTTDGGTTWNKVTLPTHISQVPVSACFLDSSTGFVVNGPNFYKTVDKGITWSTVPLHATPAAFLSSVSAASATNVMTVPNSPTNFYRLTSNVELETAAVPSYLAQSGMCTALKAVSEGVYFVAYSFYGNPANIAKTTSYGSDWQTIASYPANFFMGDYQTDGFICSVSRDEVYLPGRIANENAVVLRSTSGGAGWEIAFRGKPNDVYRAIAKVGTGLCAVGTNGGIAMRPPGSDTWKEVAITPEDPDNYDLSAVSFFDEKTGWAVGENGKLLKY